MAYETAVHDAGQGQMPMQHGQEPTMMFTDRVIRFIREVTWEDLPLDVRHQSKRCLLDTLSATIAGAETPVGRIMAKIARTQFGGNEATVLVHGFRTSAAGAAATNGFAGNALDIDDGYRLVKGHPGACVLPVILATAEQMPSCTGSEFLTALVVGYEIGIRAGRIRHACCSTYHSSGSWGAISGAAAGGRLLGLNETQLRHALGTAEYHAPIAPMMKCIATPSMGKDSIGWGAMVAMLSVLMAKEGFTGIEPLFSDTPEPEWVKSLGHEWQILNLYFKPYAACRWAQPAIDGILKVKREHSLSASSVRGIRIRTFRAACALSLRPPANTEEAQYNIAFPVAAAFLDEEVGPRQVQPPRLFDKALLELLSKVTAEVDARFEADFPSKTYAEVIVQTREGDFFSSGRMEPRWEPPDTLPTDGELGEKFLSLAGPVIGEKRGRDLIERVWSAEQWGSLHPIFDSCSGSDQ
jgi:2-methylcitrate dehydratase PrpD